MGGYWPPKINHLKLKTIRNIYKKVNHGEKSETASNKKINTAGTKNKFEMKGAITQWLLGKKWII